MTDYRDNDRNNYRDIVSLCGILVFCTRKKAQLVTTMQRKTDIIALLLSPKTCYENVFRLLTAGCWHLVADKRPDPYVVSQ